MREEGDGRKESCFSHSTTSSLPPNGLLLLLLFRERARSCLIVGLAVAVAVAAVAAAAAAVAAFAVVAAVFPLQNFLFLFFPPSFPPSSSFLRVSQCSPSLPPSTLLSQATTSLTFYFFFLRFFPCAISSSRTKKNTVGRRFKKTPFVAAIEPA